MNEKALEAALQAYRDYWTECGGAGFPIPAIGAAIEAYHAALPAEGGLVEEARRDGTTLAWKADLVNLVQRLADALEAARAAAPETSDDR